MYYYLYMNMSMFFFLCFMLFMFLTFNFLFFNIKYFIEIELMSVNSMKSTILFYFDFKSFIFMFVVVLISSLILLYSISYMSLDFYKFRFMILLSLFVVSMLLMIIGQNLLMILLGWDGLGLISYCLVIYYNSWSSYNAGMLTVLTNRLGDVGMLISIGLLSFMGSWNYLFMSFNFFFLLLMMLFCFITKSAQIPFSSWLPAAMAAPTPISSLVHSSTLVTAGIYLLMRFFNFMYMNMSFLKLLLYLGLMTMFMAGVTASLENDFKKIIALSTLSQLGLMMMSLCLMFNSLSFFHLIIHALFKSLLFMCSGLILHNMIDNQDIRFMGSMNLSFFLTMIYFNCSNLSLCGFPFMSGFYSKDMIVEMGLIYNKMYLIMFIFYVSIGLTVMYTFRLLFYMNIFYMKFYSYSLMNDNLIMNLSMSLLFIFSIMGGMIFSKFMYMYMALSFISSGMKLLVNFVILMGVILGMVLNYFFNYMKIFKYKIYLDLIYFLKKMFGLVYLYEYFYLSLNMSVNFYFYIEKGWILLYSIMFLELLYKSINLLFCRFNIINIMILLVYNLLIL